MTAQTPVPRSYGAGRGAAPISWGAPASASTDPTNRAQPPQCCVATERSSQARRSRGRSWAPRKPLPGRGPGAHHAATARGPGQANVLASRASRAGRADGARTPSTVESSDPEVDASPEAARRVIGVVPTGTRPLGVDATGQAAARWTSCERRRTGCSRAVRLTARDAPGSRRSHPKDDRAAPGALRRTRWMSWLPARRVHGRRSVQTACACPHGHDGSRSPGWRVRQPPMTSCAAGEAWTADVVHEARTAVRRSVSAVHVVDGERDLDAGELAGPSLRRRRCRRGERSMLAVWVAMPPAGRPRRTLISGSHLGGSAARGPSRAVYRCPSGTGPPKVTDGRDAHDSPRNEADVQSLMGSAVLGSLTWCSAGARLRADDRSGLLVRPHGPDQHVAHDPAPPARDLKQMGVPSAADRSCCIRVEVVPTQGRHGVVLRGGARLRTTVADRSAAPPRSCAPHIQR